MNNPDPNYDFSIFRPVNEFSRRNRNIILSILIIWVIAIFGFQLLLLILEKPTPEKALVTYESVADQVLSGVADPGQQKAFAGSLLMTLGKTILPEDRQYLDMVLTQTIFNLLQDSTGKSNLLALLTPLAEKRAALAALNESWEKKSVRFNEYKQGTFALNEDIARLKKELGDYLFKVSDRILPSGDKFLYVMQVWLPHELKYKAITEPQKPEKEKLDKIMRHYLTHNQSFLTDFRFLGFPFHYFYTAVFLLVLFVGLCILYAYRIEHLHRKFQTED